MHYISVPGAASLRSALDITVASLHSFCYLWKGDKNIYPLTAT